MFDRLLKTLGNGEHAVISFTGTGQRDNGNGSFAACALASMNAVAILLDYERQGKAPLDLMGMIAKRPFHEVRA